MSEKRKCLNCRHRILKDSSSFCDIDAKFLHYDEVFEGWCRHWAKQKPVTDEELSRIKFDDLSQKQIENTKINSEAINEWLNKERQKVFEASGITLPPNDYFIDIANHYNISHEECMRRIWGCFGVRPIRKEQDNEQTASED